uniref:Uncharacterized protein n=1 Tax=Anopheles albimanus TaxID=7167 RepID=A0A182FWX9_ANOAL
MKIVSRDSRQHQWIIVRYGFRTSIVTLCAKLLLETQI